MRRELLTPVEGLSEKHDLAISYFFRGYTKKQAAVKAGYASTYTTELFNLPIVKKEIERRLERLREKTEMDKEYLLRKLHEIIEPNVGDLIEVQEDGSGKLDFRKMTPALRKVIGKFTIDTSREGGKYKRTKTRVSVSALDKIAAIKEAAAILGIKTEKVEVTASEQLIKTLTDRRKHLAEKKDDGNSGEVRGNGGGHAVGSGEPEADGGPEANQG